MESDQFLKIKGEGGANVVVEYKCLEKSQNVIRIRKSCNNSKSSAETEQSHLLENETWGTILSSSNKLNILEADKEYIEKIIGPLIGPEYLPHQQLITLSKEEQRIYSTEKAVLMPDVTLLPTPPSSSTMTTIKHTICIEIKPKFGTILQCPTVRPEDTTLKHSTSRYRLHQLLKLQQGKIEETNEYDPIDLFSGDQGRMESALVALMKNPQNNFIAFVDGERVRDPLCSAEKASAALFSSGLLGVNTMTKDNASERLAKLLALLLQQEPVLGNIQKAQQLCKYDIEGIHRLYCHLLNGTEDSKAAEEEMRPEIQQLLELPRPAALEILHSYVTSTTARDCSIMIAMQAREIELNGGSEEEAPKPRLQQRVINDNNDDSLCGVLLFDNLVIKYRITVVDLDRKALSKIPKHLELDRKIVAAALRTSSSSSGVE